MAKERVFTYRNVGTESAPVWEKWFQKTVADAVMMSDSDTETKNIVNYVDEKIAELIGTAPETYNTLQEIAEYIASHQEVADALNTAIANKADKEHTHDNYVEKVAGKGLSANDYTTEDKELLQKVNSDLASHTHDEYVEKVDGKGLSTNDFTDEDKDALDAVDKKLADKADKEHSHDNYVEKVTGKGLSANDYTNEDKELLQTVNTELGNKVSTSRKINNKALTEDITLDADDVGAVATTSVGAAGGVAELDETGKVPAAQLPSYVDDVLEYDAKASFPAAGEAGKIYVDKATNLTYRWSGTAYVEISGGLALGETSSTAYRGDRGKIAYEHSQADHAPANAEANVQSDWNVTDTSSDAYIKNKPTSLPANGGDADTVNGHTVEANVPANAKFTDTVYTHPSTHAASMITQDATHRFVSDTEKAAWNAKANIYFEETLPTTAPAGSVCFLIS